MAADAVQLSHPNANYFKVDDVMIEVNILDKKKIDNATQRH